MDHHNSTVSAKSINDYLDEDPSIPSQQYFVLSYILPGPKNRLTTPMIKMRGSYKTKDECRARIEKLRPNEKFFNMFIVDVGKWGSLLTDEQIENNTEIDVEYQSSEMNKIYKEIKEEKEKAIEQEKNNIEENKRRTKEEGTKEFQEYILFLNSNETLKDAKFIHNVPLYEVEEFKKSVNYLDEYLLYCERIRSSIGTEYQMYKKIKNEQNFQEELQKLATEIKSNLELFFKPINTEGNSENVGPKIIKCD